MNFKETFKTKCVERVSYDQIEYLDKQITYILDFWSRYAEGPRRRVPFSKKKEKITSAVLYQKARLGLIKGGKINRNIIEKRRIDA